MQKRVTLSIDSSVYDSFQKYCDEKDMVLSKRVERHMKEELEDNKKGVKK